MTDVTTLLAGIKTRALAATEGPWAAEVYDLTQWVFSESHILEAKLGYLGNRPEADAAFIAAARTDVPRLVAALEAVVGLHKRESRWTHPEWTGSFRTRQDAVDCGDEADIDSFDICAECGRIESEQLSESGEEWGYRESLWPCPTITAVTAALGVAE